MAEETNAAPTASSLNFVVVIVLILIVALAGAGIYVYSDHSARLATLEQDVASMSGQLCDQGIKIKSAKAAATQAAAKAQEKAK